MNFLTRMWKQLCCNANPGRIFSSKSDQECISDFCNSAFECTAFYLSKSNLKKVLAYNSTRWQKIWVGWLGEKVASRSEFLFMRSSKVPQMEDLVDDQDALHGRWREKSFSRWSSRNLSWAAVVWSSAQGGGGQQRHLVSTPTLVAEPIGTPVRGSTVSRSAPHHQQVLSKAKTRFLAAIKTRFLSGWQEDFFLGHYLYFWKTTKKGFLEKLWWRRWRSEAAPPRRLKTGC